MLRQAQVKFSGLQNGICIWGPGVLAILFQCHVTVSYIWGPPGPKFVDVMHSKCWGKHKLVVMEGMHGNVLTAKHLKVWWQIVLV